MPCLAAPQIPLPALPSPLSLSLSLQLPTLSTPSLSLTLCCTFNLPSISISLPPLELGFLGEAAVAAIQAFLFVIQQINAFLAQLTISCPLD